MSLLLDLFFGFLSLCTLLAQRYAVALLFQKLNFQRWMILHIISANVSCQLLNLIHAENFKVRGWKRTDSEVEQGPQDGSGTISCADPKPLNMFFFMSSFSPHDYHLSCSSVTWGMNHIHEVASLSLAVRCIWGLVPLYSY